MADAEGPRAMGSPLLKILSVAPRCRQGDHGAQIPWPPVGFFDAVKALLDGGADPNEITKFGESPLRVSSHFGPFDVVGLLLRSGADPEQLGWTRLFHEIAFGTTGIIKPLLDQGPDLTARDYWDRTPWLLALLLGDVEKAELLLAAGSDPNAHGRCGKTPIAYAIESGHIDMLRWLIDRGFDIEAVDEFEDTPLITAAELGATECVRVLLEVGADVFRENQLHARAIESADNLDIVELLIDAGEDLNDINNEIRARFLGLETDQAPLVSEEDYSRGKRRRFGDSNPERADNKFWKAMVKSGGSASHARNLFDPSYRADEPPVWCYERFGKSINALGDGRFIEIAGEHEDYYMDDFCIYNDVFVHKGKGEFDIFIYPKDVFPPTDFHTATLVDQHIFIIGNLGYLEDRQPRHTPVYRLHVDTLKIEKIKTRGENPGWISRHKAYCTDETKIVIKGGKVIVVSNGKQDYVENRHEYSLSLKSFEWSRVG